MRRRPSEEGELPEYYAGYVALVPDGPILATLEGQLMRTLELVWDLADEDALQRYASGKWSAKEVLGHIADTERVMAYRALRIARGDATPMPGFEQDDYVATAAFDTRPLPDLLGELEAVRAATVALFRGLPADSFDRRGTASGVSFSARALAWIIAGHELHHRRILQERYLRA